MPLLIKETLEMFCPICEKEHGMYKVVEMENVAVNGKCVEVEQEKYFCGEENECFMDGEMVDNNLKKIKELIQ